MKMMMIFIHQISLVDREVEEENLYQHYHMKIWASCSRIKHFNLNSKIFILLKLKSQTFHSYLI